MQIYAQLNDNKSIKDFSMNEKDDYQPYTIDEADAHFLAEYYNLMYVDDNGLVHAENLPATQYERNLAKQEDQVKNESQSVDDKLDEINSKIQEGADLNNKLDTKIQNTNGVLNQITKSIAELQSTKKQ